MLGYSEDAEDALSTLRYYADNFKKEYEENCQAIMKLQKRIEEYQVRNDQLAEMSKNYHNAIHKLEAN